MLAEALAERKLPSFAMSRSYVDAGIMACIGDESGRDQIFRKLALIVEESRWARNWRRCPCGTISTSNGC